MFTSEQFLSLGNNKKTHCFIGVLSNRQPGRLPGDFDNRYAWVQIQILAPECQEPVQMKLKIQMKHLESIQMKLKIQMEPIESIQMEPIESI